MFNGLDMMCYFESMALDQTMFGWYTEYFIFKNPWDFNGNFWYYRDPYAFSVSNLYAGLALKSWWWPMMFGHPWKFPHSPSFYNIVESYDEANYVAQYGWYRLMFAKLWKSSGFIYNPSWHGQCSYCVRNPNYHYYHWDYVYVLSDYGWWDGHNMFRERRSWPWSKFHSWWY